MHVQPSKASCSPQAAAAHTNTIAGPSAVSTKIQHKQQKFLAAAAKCHQSPLCNFQSPIKHQRKSSEIKPRSSSDVAWRSPLLVAQSTTTTTTTTTTSATNDCFNGRPTATPSNMRRHNVSATRCSIEPLLEPTLQTCCCCPNEHQLSLQATPTISAPAAAAAAAAAATDNNVAVNPEPTSAPNDQQQVIKRPQQQLQPSKQLIARNARSKQSAALISDGNCIAVGCNEMATTTANKCAEPACCASVTSVEPKISNQTAGHCSEVARKAGTIGGHQDQVRRPSDTNAGHISSGANNNNRGHYHPQYYNHHHISGQTNNYYYRQPQNYFGNYNHHHHHQHQHQHQHHQQPTQVQPTQQVMAHYKFHNDCQSSVLTYEQVERLDHVMDQVVPIHGRGNTPTLYVKLKELIRLVKHKLQNEHSIEIRDVRLNGGAASYVLAPENSHYNDLDLIFGTDLSNEDRFDVIRNVVLECLMEFHPDKQHQMQNQLAKQNSSQKPTNECSTDVDNNSHGSHQIDTIGSNEFQDDLISDQFSRSDRSSSFESDNLNVTINESEVGKSDDEEDQENRLYIKSGDDSVETLSSSLSAIEKTSEYETDINEDQSVNLQVRDEIVVNVIKGGHIDVHSVEDDANQHQEQQINPSTTPQPNHYQYIQMPPNNCAIKEAYVHKMVKVNDDDRWSLISLGVQQSETTNCCGQDHASASNSCGMVTFASIAQEQQHGITSGCPKQQKQFPNSIELKFVDRMRRKFEFSVDSFQIILDSLIQFYDYAPQSTITIQKKLANSHLSSTMIDTARPIGNNERCSRCLSEKQIPFDHTTMLNGGYNDLPASDTSPTRATNYMTDTNGSGNEKQNQQPKNRRTSLNGTRGIYGLSLDHGGSLVSHSSVASSSGCSSSSSVVSSSSSSLSCDEDQEDLYCEADNPPSSSASTSSLLSSTTASVLSSTDSTGIIENHINSSQENHLQAQRRVSSTMKQTKSNKIMVLDSTLSAPPANTITIDKEVNSNDCTECFDKDQHNSTIDCGNSLRQCNSLIKKNLCDYGTNRTSCAVISENFYPTVIGRSEYGNFKEALYHLEKKLIATRSPEEIRGGGLLKYCNLLVKNYKPTNVYQIRTLERYMCSRFFIDFSDLNQQRAKLESYLANHFSDDPIQKFDYLTILHNVVQRSTVCLMNHELRLTLNMIREFAYNLNEQQIQQRQQHAQIQDYLQQQQTRSAQSAYSSSNHVHSTTQEQHYYQPYSAKAQNYPDNGTSNNATNTAAKLVKT